ncbi:hypothetical protein LIA77_05426 [Sarocladium implicatum]|nr:hypothetical protein LIA77_05426 [Sarocladium implicatum]
MSRASRSRTSRMAPAAHRHDSSNIQESSCHAHEKHRAGGLATLCDISSSSSSISIEADAEGLYPTSPSHADQNCLECSGFPLTSKLIAWIATSIPDNQLAERAFRVRQHPQTEASDSHRLYGAGFREATQLVLANFLMVDHSCDGFDRGILRKVGCSLSLVVPGLIIEIARLTILGMRSRAHRLDASRHVMTRTAFWIDVISIFAA